MQQYLRHIIKETPDIVCVNPDGHGLATLFQVYPKGTDAQKQRHRELTGSKAKAERVLNHQFQEKVAHQLREWFRDGKLHAGDYAPDIQLDRRLPSHGIQPEYHRPGGRHFRREVVPHEWGYQSCLYADADQAGPHRQGWGGKYKPLVYPQNYNEHQIKEEIQDG
jgi:hypothetical protein